MRSIADALSFRRSLKRGWRLQRSGEVDALAALAEEHSDTRLHQPLRAMLAKCRADDDDRGAALEAFNGVYAALKGSEHSPDRHVKLYALYNLALLRNSIPDAAYCARKARQLHKVGPVRTYLPIPMLLEPVEAGPAITAMV